MRRGDAWSAFRERWLGPNTEVALKLLGVHFMGGLDRSANAADHRTPRGYLCGGEQTGQGLLRSFAIGMAERGSTSPRRPAGTVSRIEIIGSGGSHERIV